MSFIMCVFVLWIIWFIFWQFKMIKKYVLSFDRCVVRAKEGYVAVNGREMNFDEIEGVTVREKEQPSALEKTFSKSAFYAYMSEMAFHLKDGACVTCTFNTKGALYKTLRQLAPCVAVNADINRYKPQSRWGYLLLIVAGVLFALLIKSCRG